MIDSRAYIRGHKVWPHCDLAFLGGRGRDYFSLSRGSNFSLTWEYFLLGVAENSYSAVHIYAGVNKYASPLMLAIATINGNNCYL